MSLDSKAMCRIVASSTGGKKIVSGRGTSQDSQPGWLAFECPERGCKRKGQKMTRRQGKRQAVLAKPIPACLAEGHVKVYSNGQCNYKVVDGPSDVKFDEEEYPDERSGYCTTAP